MNSRLMGAYPRPMGVGAEPPSTIVACVDAGALSRWRLFECSVRPVKEGLRIAVASLVLAALLTACQSDGQPPEAGGSPSDGPTAISSSTDTSTEPPEEESRRERATRLAKSQLRAFYKVQNDLLQHPGKPLSVLEEYLRDQVLVERQQYTQGFRDRGERQVGASKLIKFRVRDVVFQEDSPRAAVDLEVCYDLGDSHFVNASGQVVPPRPGAIKVGYARFALFSDELPSTSREDWRIGRQEVQGQPCTL